VLNQRLTGFGQQRLARQAGGREANGEYADGAHLTDHERHELHEWEQGLINNAQQITFRWCGILASNWRSGEGQI
jgi:hypothetical protein